MKCILEEDWSLKSSFSVGTGNFILALSSAFGVGFLDRF